MNLLPNSPIMKVVATLALVATSTVVALGLQALGVTDAGIVLTFLMAVVLSSWGFGFPYSILSSVLAILTHSFLFSVPIYSFEVYNPQHLIAFVFMVGVGLVVSTLSARLRDQVEHLGVRERRLQDLHRLALALADKIEGPEVIRTAETLLSSILDASVKITDGALPPATGTRAFALAGGQGGVGWVLVEPGPGPDPFLPERKVWIETLLAPVAQALDRASLVQERQDQSRRMEATVTRNTILHGISHDLRTPLTVISATAGSILERTNLDDPRRNDLESLASESQAVVRQVENLLELTSLTSGSVEPRWEWIPIEDLVYPCLETFSQRFPQSQAECHIPSNPGLCRVDETLVNRALTNLLENTALYAPGPVVVTVSQAEDRVRFEVADRGTGVPEAEKRAIFGHFFRGEAGRRTAGHRGTGLGLALVQCVAGLHGGSAGVEDRPGGGSVFWFELAQTEAAPPLWGGEL